jgi:hypothetical protein
MPLNEETQNRPRSENPGAETDPRGKGGTPSVWKRFLTNLLRARAVAVV